MPFLTLEDPNAKLKGSRDPLGVVPLWVYFARQVVTNLTTPSNSIRGFTTLLLGRYFAEKLISEGRVPKEEALNIVLRMEQLSAYVRYKGHAVESDIRGIERVKQNCEENNGIVTIQADRHGMLLADQKVYGLWGLYSVPSRASGLLTDGPIGVTNIAKKFIEENYLPHLESCQKSLLAVLAKGDKLNVNENKQPEYFKALKIILSPKFTPTEQEFYAHHIRDAEWKDKDHVSRQAIFRDLLERYGQLDKSVSRDELLSVYKLAENKDPVLARSIDKILRLEALLAPADALFNFLLRTDNNNQKPEIVAEKLKERWGDSVPNLDLQAFDELKPEIKKVLSDDTELTNTIYRCYGALASGDYPSAISALMDWNARVMEARKAGPWIKLSENGLLEVRYKGADQELPNKEDLPTLWRNSYFIDSLKSVTRQLREAA